MSTILTNEEKAAIVSQHIKNIEYSIYNLEVSIIEEEAVQAPDSSKISNLNSDITELNAKKAALTTELATLSAQEYKMADRAELIITALQQRIGEIVSNYETQIAILRAEITNLMEEKDAKTEAVQDYSERLNDLTAN